MPLTSRLSVGLVPLLATVIPVTPTRPVAAGVVLYWYQSASTQLNTSGTITYAGSPLQITLPIGWANTDILTITYQAQ